MSFGFGVSDFVTLLQLATKVRKRFVDSPAQFLALSDEVKNLSNTLRDLDDLVPERQLDNGQQSHLRDCIGSCEVLLCDLDQTLNRYQEIGVQSSGIGAKSKRIWKRLRFEPEDIRDLRSRLTSNLALLNAFYASLSDKTLLVLDAKVDKLVSRQQNERRRELADWLSNADFAAQQTDLLRRRQEGTGRWLLDSKRFHQWLDGSNPVLFCPGIPGAGKTMVTCTVIEHLQLGFAANESIGICFLYCSYQRQSEQHLEYFLSAILEQLLRGLPNIPQAVLSLYEQHIAKRTRPSEAEYVDTIKSLIQHLSSVYIVVDAVDECTIHGEVQRRLLNVIMDLHSTTGARLFVTSRLIPEIEIHFQDGDRLEIRADESDVRRYLEAQVKTLPLCVQRDQDLQRIICAKILEAIDGMFLLAKLHLDFLKYKKTRRLIQRTLEDLPKGSEALSIAYNEVVERIQAQPDELRDLAEQTLCWITHAEQPLTVLELQHALAVEDAPDFDEDGIPEIEDIVSVCFGLIVVDQESSIVRFVHYTTQQYFEKLSSAWISVARQQLAKSCLLYMSYEPLADGPSADSAGYSARLQRYALLEYAARHWQVYAHTTPMACWEPFAVRFFTDTGKVSSILQIMDVQFIREDGRPLTAYGVHLAVYLGLLDFVERLIDQHGQSVNARDSKGYTPLVWAILLRQINASQKLLQRDDVSANSRDDDGRTPLSHAAQSGDVYMTQELLARSDVDIDAEDITGRTPLWWAAIHGKSDVVELLLAQDRIDINAQGGWHGRSMLSDAVAQGHDKVVALLLGRQDLRVNTRNEYRDTPLHTAMMDGNKSMVKMLLARSDLTVNARNEGGRTPLTAAVREWHSYSRWSDTRQSDPKMKSIHVAMHAVVELLLARKDVEVNAQEAHGGDTALILASSFGLNNAVELLLARSDIDVNASGPGGRTPLLAVVSAWSNFPESGDHEAVLQHLLARNDLDINLADFQGDTALTLAANAGLETAVEMLLARKGIDVEPRGMNGRTPLCCAKARGHETIVHLLEDAGAEVVQECGCSECRKSKVLQPVPERQNAVAPTHQSEHEPGDESFEDSDEDAAKMMQLLDSLDLSDS